MADKRVPNALVGSAGVHFVVSELSRRSVIALPTIRNTAGYDVIALTSDGERHANIQVKASLNRASFFPMPQPSKIRKGVRDFYVCVRWLDAENRFEAFLLKGTEARREVAADVRKQEARRRKGRKSIWPSLHVGGKHAARSAVWKKRWETWSL